MMRGLFLIVACLALVPLSASGAAAEYESEGKRDPFRPLSMMRTAKPDPITPLTPLQRYEIGQLKLVGIISRVEPPRAMVEDSSGLGFILTPGTPIGRNGGVVKDIRERGVVVEEWHTDIIGERHRKEIVMVLASDESEFQP
ncbi:MAG: pilus assembly protein PilP [Candidatus Binatia bacterium]|nr:pilus assembly protein PilP [Candidatus Binatia bacterium]MDG1959802.1 pilus assembly protein PilP [Candidatus Binatia bacterium]MDG2010137.1 pilus assembly protein PilP [Candidatus Binatia bacterium]